MINKKAKRLKGKKTKRQFQNHGNQLIMEIMVQDKSDLTIQHKAR